MEQEKKKRFRPTLTAYRALESEVVELRKAVSQDLLAQNKKLKTELAKMEASSVQMSTFEDILNKNRVLELSNEHLDYEVKRLREQLKEATEDYQRARREVLWLHGRGLWQRITNDTDYKENEGD